MRANFELREVLFDDCDFSHTEVWCRGPHSSRSCVNAASANGPPAVDVVLLPCFYRFVGGGFNLMLPRSPWRK